MPPHRILVSWLVVEVGHERHHDVYVAVMASSNDDLYLGNHNLLVIGWKLGVDVTILTYRAEVGQCDGKSTSWCLYKLRWAFFQPKLIFTAFNLKISTRTILWNIYLNEVWVWTPIRTKRMDDIIKINDEHVMFCKSEQVTNSFLFLVD